MGPLSNSVVTSYRLGPDSHRFRNAPTCHRHGQTDRRINTGIESSKDGF